MSDQSHQPTRSDLGRLPAMLGGLMVAIGVAATGSANAPIDFVRDIRPILSDKCFACHGPAEDSRAAGLRLDVREEAIGFTAIVPGSPEASSMLKRVLSDDDDLRMPPPESHKTLDAEEINLLRNWIEEGAAYEPHWSLKPPQRQEALASDGDTWARNEVDRFVLRRLQAGGIASNREADRRTWLRRVTFDLTGLPPTQAELRSFVGDRRPDAYERVVDRLLDTDAHAERMASEWLDVARYSDSYGYQRDDARFVWPYRDWVIDSFRRNRPYDVFVTWQIAGDLLPDATREQRLATTFCRLHSHKKEGGVAVEEFRVENVADRTHTFASAFLGLTMECARCHDHKYDPITIREYYQLSSFFANVDERGLISYFTDATPTPAMTLPSPGQEAELQAAEAAVSRAERAVNERLISARTRFDEWVATSKATVATPTPVADIDFDKQEPNPPEELLHNENTGFVAAKKSPRDRSNLLAFANGVEPSKPAITSTANRITPGVRGDGLRLTGDDAVVVPGVGKIERHQPITVMTWIKPATLAERAVVFRRSGGWDDAGSIGYALIQRGGKLRATMAHFWPGNAISVESDQLLAPDEWRHVAMTYDGSSRARGLRIYVDGERADRRVVQDHLTRTITGWRGGYQDLAIGSRYRDKGFKDGSVDEFRVFDRALTAIEVRQEFLGPTAQPDIDALFEYFVAVVDEPSRDAQADLQQARRRRGAIIDAVPAITVMREQSTPRPAFVLERGVYDARGEQVTADTPAALPSFPADAPRNRLGLARWLFEPNHPLTARVAVNRYWQMLFGHGLVRTPEDFGSQGEPPTHPELLDWLASDFAGSGWDVRRLLRMLVLSSTYRQDSVVDAETRRRDPENRLLSRGPSKALPAEMVRDHALAASGLLVHRVGGPPVKPYDLPLAYTPVAADKGDGLYRRSLYTFWKRTSPSPVMMTMNANPREVCLLRREAVSSPLQALVLLNGTQFVEASRMLADGMLTKHNRFARPAIAEAFLQLTSRPPTPQEIGLLMAAHDEQLDEYRSRPELADKLLAVGAARPRSSAPTAELAAAAVVINAIMNLDEVTRCR
ncbi:MAG: DUF1553 domain-containing protein [Planctomycetota bacterium]